MLEDNLEGYEDIVIIMPDHYDTEIYDMFHNCVFPEYCEGLSPSLPVPQLNLPLQQVFTPEDKCQPEMKEYISVRGDDAVRKAQRNNSFFCFECGKLFECGAKLSKHKASCQN